MDKGLETFINSFKHTGIYIIDRDSMEVYYENDTARKYTGRNRNGEACYLTHGNNSMCASCPLRREDKTSFVIREDYGMVFIIQAVETVWEGIPSYIITVRKQIDMPLHDRSVNEGMTKRMNRAINSTILTYCEVNMKTLMCKCVHFDDAEDMIEGIYDAHIRKLAQNVIHQEDIDRFLDELGVEHLTKISSDSNGPLEISVRYRTNGRGSESIMLESTAYFLRDELPHYVSIITREVTNEEKLREESLIKGNIITQVINNDYDYVILIDLLKNTAKTYTGGEYQPVETGDAGQYIVDYLKNNYYGDDLKEFLHYNTLDYVRKRLDENGRYIEYYYVNEKNRGPRYKKGTYTYANGDKRYIIFARTDNTEAVKRQQEINERLTEALRKSDEAARARNEIFSRMSHDLRTPMNAIVGLSKLGADETEDENSREYFEKIDTSADYLLGLINDILDMNKLEHDRIELHEEAVDSTEFIQEVVEILRPLVSNKKINLVLDFGRTDAPYVYCDIIRTRQVFINFLSNAIKFSDPGSTVTWSCRELGIDNGCVTFEMQFIDHGCGMSEEFVSKAFEPFEQEHNRFSSENSSTGLGLAIVKNLVRIMGGSIEVSSAIGEGSIFTLRLHQRIADERSVRKSHARPAIQINLAGKRILAVEDQQLNLDIECRLLNKQGVIVTTASNGQEAVEEFMESCEGYFDAVLMDIRMPVMDGIEAAKRIRALDREDARIVPIIATTANAFEEDRRLTKEAGMDAHLSKPINPKELYETLSDYIG